MSDVPLLSTGKNQGNDQMGRLEWFITEGTILYSGHDQKTFFTNPVRS